MTRVVAATAAAGLVCCRHLRDHRGTCMYMLSGEVSAGHSIECNQSGQNRTRGGPGAVAVLHRKAVATASAAVCVMKKLFPIEMSCNRLQPRYLHPGMTQAYSEYTWLNDTPNIPDRSQPIMSSQ